LLRARLVRRGVSLPAALCALALGEGADAASAATVARAVARSSVGGVSARAAAGAREGGKDMQITMGKTGVLVVLATGLLAAGVGLAGVLARPGADLGGPAQQPQAAARAPKGEKPKELYFPTREGTQRVYAVRVRGTTHVRTDTATKVEKK